MPDIRGLLSDPEFKALPPERQLALLAKINPALAEEFAAASAPAAENPVLGAEAEDPRLSPERMSFRGASSMATSEPQRQEMTPLEGAVTAAGATAALGALGGGTGAVPAAARFAMSPAGSGVISGGTALAKGADPLTALGAGLGAAATDKVLGGSKALRSMLGHTLARGAKVAEKEVSKTVGEQIKKIAAPTVDDVARRAMELANAPNAKYSRGQIASILRSEFAAGEKGIGVGYFRRFVDQMLDNAAQAAKGGG